MEDVWIYLWNEVDVSRMDYCQLTSWQIIDLDLFPIPEGVENDNMILDN